MKKKPVPAKDYIVTVSATVTGPVEQAFTISAASYGDAVKQAMNNFEAEHNIIELDTVEIEVQRE